MKKLNVLEDQINLFNMPIQELVIKPKEKVIVEKQEISEGRKTYTRRIIKDVTELDFIGIGV